MLIILLCFSPVISLAEGTGQATDDSVVGKVHVSIEDSIPKSESPDDPGPRGMMAEGEIDLYKSDSVMSVIVRLAKANNLEILGAEEGYISSIGGLAQKERGSLQSGWMGTLNDWFTNKGFKAFTVENGELKDGDYIRVQYTLDLGVDLGGGFGSNELNTDNTLKSLAASSGNLLPDFNKDTHEYVLKVPAGTESLVVIPEASNKNYMVETKVGETVYRYKREIPVEDGTIITVTCGDPSWPSMSPAPEKAQVYHITVQEETLTIKDPDNLFHKDGKNFYVFGKSEGTGFQLVATDESGNPVEVTWSSDDKRKPTSTIDENGYVTVKTEDRKFINQGAVTEYYATKKSNPDIKAKYTVVLLPRIWDLDDAEATMNPEGDEMPVIKRPVQFFYWYETGANGIFSVENPEVAAVADNGMISVKRPGTTKIFFNTDVGTLISTEMTLRVKGVLVRPVKEAEPTYIIGDELQFEAIGESPEETFTWESSNSEVAEVDQNGLVTAKKEGAVLIYAISSNQSEGEAARGAYKMMVARSKDAPYIKLIDFYNANMFDGYDGFAPTKLEYNLIAKSNAADLGFHCYVRSDYSKYDLYRIYYRIDGTEDKVKLSPFGQHTVPLHSGNNKIIFRIVETGNEENKTDYIYNIYKDKSEDSYLKSAFLKPIDRAPHKVPKYKGYAEFDLLKLKDGEVFGYPGFDRNITEYKTYIFKDGNSFNVDALPLDLESKVRISVNGGTYKDFTEESKKEPIDIGNGSVTVKIAVCSHKTYSDNIESGMDDPFVAEKIYTFDIEQVNITNSIINGLSLNQIEVSPGYFCAPGKREIIVPGECEEVELAITLDEGISLYDGYKIEADESNKLERGNDGKIRMKLDTKINKHYVVASIKAGDEVLTNIAAFNISKQKFTEGLPITVLEYIVPGSQYTNRGPYGLYPEKSLLGNGSWNTPVSLGNFGGYIVYKYDKAIVNDPNNKYGIDFIVYGNSNGSQGFSEPGNVMVSQDGNKWYTLAGADHYENHAIWDYSVTYHCKGFDQFGNLKASLTDSLGEYKEDGAAGYPLKENYPFYPWKDGEETDITFTGLLLNVNAKDQYGTLAAAFPDWGYADTHTNSKMVNGTGENITLTREAGNPYCDDREGYGDGFDLEWAVDEAGRPVQLDSVNYVKIQTASNIYAGAIGEKSTEVNAVVVPAATESNVGETAKPEAVTINGNTVEIGETGTYTSFDNDRDSIDIKVITSDDANIYINGQRGAERTYETIPDKKLVRIVVQEGEKEPYICLVRVNKAPSLTEGNESETEKTINLGSEFAIDLSAIFEDGDMDELEYAVAVDGSEPVKIAADYKITPDEAGKMTLVFTASDGNSETKATYKVTLDVRDIKKTINNGDGSVSVEFPEAIDVTDVKLSVEMSDNNYDSKLEKGKYAAYSIMLTDENDNEISVSELTDGGKITVRIDLSEDLKDGKNVKLFFDDGEGNLTEYPSTINDGALEFETDHLSVWVTGIMKSAENNEPTEPDTPDAPGANNENNKPDKPKTPETHKPDKATLENNSEAKNAAKTGDDSNMSLFMITLLSASGAIIALRRKRNNKITL